MTVYVHIFADVPLEFRALSLVAIIPQPPPTFSSLPHVSLSVCVSHLGFAEFVHQVCIQKDHRQTTSPVPSATPGRLPNSDVNCATPQWQPTETRVVRVRRHGVSLPGQFAQDELKEWTTQVRRDHHPGIDAEEAAMFAVTLATDGEHKLPGVDRVPGNK